jgi:hypothetical protein
MIYLKNGKKPPDPHGGFPELPHMNTEEEEEAGADRRRRTSGLEVLDLTGAAASAASKARRTCVAKQVLLALSHTAPCANPHLMQ